MYQENTKKNKVKLSVAIILAVVVFSTIFTAGVSYLNLNYSNVTFDGDKALVSIANLDLVYDTGFEIDIDVDVDINNVSPGWIDYKYFSIENSGATPASYDIKFGDVSNTFINKPDLVYLLNGNTFASETSAPDSDATIATNVVINPGETQSFVLIINYKDDAIVQTENQAFYAKIIIEERAKEYPFVSYDDKIDYTEITVEYEDNSDSTQYRIDSGEWKDYTGKVTIAQTSLFETRQVKDSQEKTTSETIGAGSVYISCGGVNDNSVIWAAIIGTNKKYNIIFEENDICKFTSNLYSNAEYKYIHGNGATLLRDEDFTFTNSRWGMTIIYAKKYTIDNIKMLMTDRPRVNGVNTASDLLGIYRSENVTIKNSEFIVDIDNPNAAASSCVKFAGDNHNVLVENNKFMNKYDADAGGVFSISNMWSSVSHTSNIVVRNNYFYQLGHDESFGIFNGANDSERVIENIYVYDNVFDHYGGKYNSVMCYAFAYSEGTDQYVTDHDGSVKNVRYENNDVHCESTISVMTVNDINYLIIKNNNFSHVKIPNKTTSGWTQQYGLFIQRNQKVDYDFSKHVLFDSNNISMRTKVGTTGLYAISVSDNNYFANNNISAIGNFSNALFTGNSTFENNSVNIVGDIYGISGSSVNLYDNDIEITGNITNIGIGGKEVVNNSVKITGNTNSVFYNVTHAKNNSITVGSQAYYLLRQINNNFLAQVVIEENSIKTTNAVAYFQLYNSTFGGNPLIIKDMSLEIGSVTGTARPYLNESYEQVIVRMINSPWNMFTGQSYDSSPVYKLIVEIE